MLRRIPFWLKVPCISSQDLELPTSTAGSGLTFTDVDTVQIPKAPPVVEVGLTSQGALRTASPLAWLPIYQSAVEAGKALC